ncbi:MAG: hypothetical protein RIR00_1695 [Pseudomonadota bacterium]|jgi:hypothetical protein
MVRIISALILAVAAALAQAETPLKLAANAPDRHIVATGDTLWGIAAKFLSDPWRWPEIWRMNKEQVHNPHRIYPGDVIVLDRSSGTPQLKIAKPLKLQPTIYSETNRQEIPSIPPHIIEPFLSRPLVIDPASLNNAPRFVATQEDRVFLGSGDLAYASPIDPAQEDWLVYRPLRALKDPTTNETLGYEAFHLGSAKLVRPGEPATLQLTSVKQEIGRGDYLLPASKPTLNSYAPHVPDKLIEAQVMSIYGGVNEAGRLAIITVNRGRNDGLEDGHVLGLFRRTLISQRDDSDHRQNITLPEERYGLLYIFRTFDRVSYALVMEANRPVFVADAVRNP